MQALRHWLEIEMDEITTLDWFDLKKYSNLSDFDLVDFHSEIMRRSLLIGFLGKKGKLKILTYINKNLINTIYENDNYFLDKSLAKKAPKKHRELYTDYFQSKFNSFGNYRGTTVKLISAGDLVHWRNKLASKFEEKLEGKEREMFNKSKEYQDTTDVEQKQILLAQIDQLEEMGAKNYYELPLHNFFKEDKLMVELNYYAPLEKILEDVKTLIKEVKSELPVPSQYITENKLASWKRYRVLQYFDLKVWSTIKGLNMTDKQIGDVIFKDNMAIDTVDTIRKYTKKYLNEMFSIEWERAIEQQIFSNPNQYKLPNE